MPAPSLGTPPALLLAAGILRALSIGYPFLSGMLISLAPAVKLLKEPTAVECEIDISIPLPQTAGTLKLELKLKVGSSLTKLKTMLGFNFVEDVLEASDSCTNDPLEVESLDDIREQLEANVELETKLCISGACRGCALGRGNPKFRGLHEENGSHAIPWLTKVVCWSVQGEKLYAGHC